MPDEELLAEIRNLRAAVEGLMVELKGQQTRTFTNSGFLIGEFKHLVRAMDDLTRKLGG
jgi:hypothetical protein